MRSTNPNHLERWLGKGAVEALAHDMRDWYGPPIAVAGVPGEVYACKGDFIGHCRAGEFASWQDMARDLGKKMYRRARIVSNAHLRNQLHVGFSTFTALRQAGLNGPLRPFFFDIVSIGGVQVGANRGMSQWENGPIPVAGTAASAAAAGRVPVGGSDGGFTPGAAPTGKNWFFAGGQLMSVNAAPPVASQGLLLYDRIFDVAKGSLSSSTATEAVTGVPTRYQGTTNTGQNYIGGNFAFPEIHTTVSATSHNWTVCKYTKEDNTTLQSFPAITGVSSGGSGTIDMAAGSWFAPLVAGDLGVANITQMQISATLAAGAINWVIGHPIAWMPAPLTNIMCDIGGISTSFNLCRIYDNACLAFLEPNRSGSGQISWTGMINVIAG